ncbi:transcription factor jumonji (jmj) family protein [Striga asiatica]|uniref:Transcription factor jumonji (Jmj) family protein n=1 Tax=Striga asiatica TaxID=4170 RepID=A0A5A7PPW6_STRAF|nr:transcription factor jumonji (jmj) family protein [Striga asiatica]
MGTELVGLCAKEDNMEPLSIPPGFESLAPFTLKKMNNNQVSSYSGYIGASKVKNVQVKTEDNSSDNSETLKSLKRKPPVKYSQSHSKSGDELESEEVDNDQDMRPKSCLPKGVIRGCEDCNNCQKVIAKWHPKEGHRPNLEEAPVFYPSKEEFEDTLKYISSIRPEAEKYGICRIVPPPSWKPPFRLKERDVWETSKFASRVQRIDKLQNRESMKKIFKVNHEKEKKRRRYQNSGVKNRTGGKEADEVGVCEAVNFGFEPGPDFTLDGFQKYADEFMAQYFRNSDSNSNLGGNGSVLDKQWQPSIEDIEGEYWRIVEKPTEEIEVLYGADVETGAFGSGFPRNAREIASTSDMEYVNSGWNLNNFPRLPGSVLSYESSDISGVLVPWLYIGMCFSSFCWHVEDHHLYSLNYMHWGAPKLWYGVPGSNALQMEAAMRKHLPDLFEEQPDLLHKLVTQISPSILRSEGVPVYRCVQNAGEFVLTFPRAYHAGFNSGFNCAEAVNVAPIDWLPHGQNAIELYREQGRQTSISHDKLLLGAAREAVKANWEYNLLRKFNSNNLRWKEVCGKDGILSKALKDRVEIEGVRREFLCKSTQSLKMESSFDADSEKECCVCLFDLHLSAAGCHQCSPHKYACLNHARQLCSCSWGAKFFLFRYDMDELKMLVEALEGKLSSVYRWARHDLGLALSSYVSKEKLQTPVQSSQGLPSKEITSPLPKVDTLEEKKKCVGSICASQDAKPPMVVLALEKVKLSSDFKKDSSLSNGKPTCKVPQVNGLKIDYSEGLASEKKLSSPENKNFIVLTDDEGDRLSEEPSGVKGTSEKPIDKVEDNAEACNSIIDLGRKKDIPEHDDANMDHGSKPQLIDSGKPKSEDSQGKEEKDVELRSMESMHNLSSPSGSRVKNIDGYYRQKGPRIAKLVRRISCNVEPLDFGGGKFWGDSRAIYPKGFRSRVKYIDIFDPTKSCFYVSEVLDAGRKGPLFLVFVEHSPSEVFIHESAGRCWEMVRERVNHEIVKKHKLEVGNLPPLQPPGSVDGIAMFGFSSPAIVIEAMDKSRTCTEYWKSRPMMQISESRPVDPSADSKSKSEVGVERILTGLLNKANTEELHTLYNLLHNHKADEQSFLVQLLRDKINDHPR